jgi:hypothetical protein
MTVKRGLIAACSIFFLMQPVLRSQVTRKVPGVVKIHQAVVQFIFTSDVHFGLQKENFRGAQKVPAVAVNAAMIEQMNRLPRMLLPGDGGVNAKQLVKHVDALAITGDITNREEAGIQRSSTSWAEFVKDYRGLLKLKNARGQNIPLWITPGNHDASDAIGFHRPMIPLKDPASMIGIYNLEMRPAIKMDSSHYDFQRDKIHYSRDMAGVHFVFVSLWPDSAERAWMAADLANIKPATPVLLFTHSMPDVEARFFVNPNGSHDINQKDKFENLVSETFKDGDAVTDSAFIEQEALVGFLQVHPNIKAWFHGHSNFTEYYEWSGPANNIRLHCFRADSPMKGKYSAKDETKLSFELVSINMKTKMLTVRECLWNPDPAHPQKLPEWGKSITISLR